MPRTQSSAAGQGVLDARYVKKAGDTMTGNLGLNAVNIVTDTTTGTKIGTATTQKLGFFNATPIVQVGATTDLGTVLSNLGLRASGTAYPITTSGTANITGTFNAHTITPSTTTSFNLGSASLVWSQAFVTKVFASVLAPLANGTTAIQITKADGTTNILNVDTTNSRIGIGTTTPAAALDVNTSPIFRNFHFAYFGSTLAGRIGSGNDFISVGGSTDIGIEAENNLYFAVGGNSTPSVTVLASGLMGLGVTSPVVSGTGNLHMAGDRVRLATAFTPATSGATGNTGEIAWDSSFIYVCVAANTWKRSAIITF